MHLIKNLRAVCVVLLFLAFTGCSSIPKLKTIDPNRPTPLIELNHWQLNARAAINTPKDNLTGKIDWTQDQSSFDFLLSGPFGVTVAHLIQQNDKATLELPDRDKQFANDAERLLQKNLGWKFPFDALAYWVKGLPSGHASETPHFNDDGRLAKLVYEQWQVTFSKYTYYQGILLPKMIKAKHPQYSIKIVAKNWLFFE